MPTSMRKPTAIDLFCGCGGMGLGLEQAGFEVLYANDISKDATKTYRVNLHAGIVDCKDIARVNPRALAKEDQPTHRHNCSRNAMPRVFYVGKTGS